MEKRKQEADMKQQVPSPSPALSLPPLPLLAEPNMNHLAKQKCGMQSPHFSITKQGIEGWIWGSETLTSQMAQLGLNEKGNVCKMLSTGPAHSRV